MFDRGIRNPKFVDALKNWKHWGEIISDQDLFVAIRKEYINIYYQGCSLFNISYDEELLLETHYKYLVRPDLEAPYVLWVGDRPDTRDLANEIFVNMFDVGSLKKSSKPYAEPEKVGLHSILKTNGNVIDVEVALSGESEDEADTAESGVEGRRGAHRIDFAAIQRRDGKPCVAFFEAKRFDNGELKSKEGEPRVFDQIREYQRLIKENEPAIETAYRTVCKNLVDLVPNRCDQRVRDAADCPEPLGVDSEVRLVVFGYDKDQDEGDVWNKHNKKLRDHFKDRLLLKGSPSEFTSGISK